MVQGRFESNTHDVYGNLSLTVLSGYVTGDHGHVELMNGDYRRHGDAGGISGSFAPGKYQILLGGGAGGAAAPLKKFGQSSSSIVNGGYYYGVTRNPDEKLKFAVGVVESINELEFPTGIPHITAYGSGNATWNFVYARTVGFSYNAGLRARAGQNAHAFVDVVNEQMAVYGDQNITKGTEVRFGGSISTVKLTKTTK